jgi:ABC-type glycerol-3-phosphate transport system substrate-binding protein
VNPISYKGNFTASPVWKGKNMKRISLFIAASFFCEVLFSGQYHYSENDLHNLMDSGAIKKSIVSGNSRQYMGVTLLELLPLMEEVYSMTIETDLDLFVLNDENLAEYWSDSYALETTPEISLLIKGILYEHVKNIEFTGTPMESDELEIWLSWEGIDRLKDELNQFALFHHIKILSVEVPKPESKLISVVRAGGSVPDIIMLQSSSVENLTAARALQNLDYMILPDFMVQGINAFSFGNRLWAFPFYSDTQVIFYNKDIIQESINLNWTLHDMERIARNSNNQSIFPLVWNAYSSNWLIPFQFSFGKTELIDSEGKISVNDLPTEKALSYVMNLQNTDLLTSMERDAMDALFIAGKVAMIISGSYAIPYFDSLGLNFGVLPLPINSETKRPVTPLMDFKGLAITQKTDSPILSRRVIQFLTSPAVQQRFCPEMSKLPARDEVLLIPGITGKYSAVLQESAKNGIVIPPLNVYNIYKNNMWKLLRFALSGRMTLRQTLEQGQTLMENTTKK